MKIDIIVSRYTIYIDDILPDGEVMFYPSGKILNVFFTTETGSFQPGRLVLDDYIDKKTQKLIRGRIKSALPEIETLLSGFNEIVNNERGDG